MKEGILRKVHEIDECVPTGLSVLPRGDGTWEPCPELLTETEAIRYLRLDIEGPAKPMLTLRYYREKGLLKATQVGRKLRYRRIELDRFLENVTR